VFFGLLIDLNETPVPLNLIVMIVRGALHWSHDHAIDAHDGGHDPDIVSLKILRSQPEERTPFVNLVPER
jgi:hypothetical protein